MTAGSIRACLKWTMPVLVACAIAAAFIASSMTRAVELMDIGLTADEKAWIQANPRIRVHNETNWPPFNFAVEGKPQGYSIDFMNLLAGRTGLEIDYVTGPSWGEFLDMMKAGTLDVMLNIVKTPDRRKYLLYTSPIADNPNSILSKKDNAYESLEQLFGKTVSVPKGFFYEEVLKREFPQINLHLVEDTLDTMKAVIFGKADAALGELAVFNHLIENHLLTGVVVSGEVKMGDPELSLLNIATRKDLPVLASILRKAVASVTPEERNTIETKWISAQHGLGVDMTLVLQLSGAVGIVVLLVVLWNYRLRRQVEESRKLEEAQRTLLHAVSLPILVVRQDNGEILYINEAAAGGRSTDELIGTQAINLYVNPSDRETFLESMRSEQMVDGLEIPFNGPDGKIIWALVSSRTITFGGYSAYLTTWTDISARRSAEAELRESEAKLKAILEHANVPVLIKDLDLNYIMANKAFVDVRKVPIEEILGKNAYDFQPRDIAAEITESDRQVIESGQPFEYENERLDVNGEYKNYFVIKYPVFGDGGKVVALGSMYTDITERKQAEAALQESEALLTSFMDNANAMMFVKDQDGRYLLSNKANADMRGFEPEEMIGKTARELLGAEEAAIYEQTDLQVMETLMPVERETRVRGADGVVRDLFSSKFPVIAENGRFIAIGSVLNDITDQKRVEEELKAAKEEAERVADAKSDFIAVISHEVRTPMNGVLGMARLMLEQPLLEEQRSQVQTIVESSEALLTILNDLLDVSKLEAGKLELETVPFATRSLITDTANVMASRAKEKGLTLELKVAPGMPHALLGDASRLRQILLNLLSNAIKFTDRGKVTVAARGMETLSGAFKLVLSVTDTGIGIPRDEAGKLFSPYFQAAVDVNRERGGTGLGLSICRQLAALMGGEVTLESTLGEGSTFTLAVPLEVTDDAPLRAAKGARQLGMTADGPRLRILMVEDNPINRKVAEGLLAKQGHKVFTAENGQEALKRIAEDDPYDIVLMDRHMPVMDGIEATKRIRAIDGPESTIPIIALTAAATPREIETCLESGMNDVVTKPIDPAQLKDALLRVAASDSELFDVDSYKGDGDETDTSNGPPVLDKAVLANLGDQIGEEDAAELIEEFRDVIRKSADAFRNDTEAGELAGMTHHSHDMKSCAAVVGLMRFSQLCHDIEVACKADDIVSATRLGESLQDELAAALAALSNSGSADRDDGNGVQSQFVSKISHDLRNVINNIHAYVLLIQESAGEDLTVDQLKDYAGRIYFAGGQIRELTDQMTASFGAQGDDRTSERNEAKSS
ncbi:MAG: PAS domain S-box protein [Alphaproteobacteria bacterium]|nr:PAS domain S-box protein [Alphaproteobacteria bacterium]